MPSAAPSFSGLVPGRFRRRRRPPLLPVPSLSACESPLSTCGHRHRNPTRPRPAAAARLQPRRDEKGRPLVGNARCPIEPQKEAKGRAPWRPPLCRRRRVAAVDAVRRKTTGDASQPPPTGVSSSRPRRSGSPASRTPTCCGLFPACAAAPSVRASSRPSARGRRPLHAPSRPSRSC